MTKIRMIRTSTRPVEWEGEIVGHIEPVKSSIGKWEFRPLSPPVSRAPSVLQQTSSPYVTIGEILSFLNRKVRLETKQ